MNKFMHKGRQTSMKGWQEVKLRRQNGDSLFFLFKDRWGKANEAVKWEKKENKADDVVGKVGRKMEGRQSLGKRWKGGGIPGCTLPFQSPGDDGADWRQVCPGRARLNGHLRSFQISPHYIRLVPSSPRIRVPVKDSVFHPESSITLNPTLCSLWENCRWKRGPLTSPAQHSVWVTSAVIPQDQRRVSAPPASGVPQWGGAWRARVQGLTKSWTGLSD